MRKLGNILILTLALSACSWSDMVDFVIPSKDGGINTELVVGDKKQEVHTEVGGQKAETITNVTDTSNLLLVLAMLGWFLPTPQGMWKAWRDRNVVKTA